MLVIVQRDRTKLAKPVRSMFTADLEMQAIVRAHEASNH
jgi:hypothetical protein